ncbi:protein monoglycylase TTLL8 [Crotalus tigris]|uniref:protein monoglycylase TTLL8 n=1 Tax=Crotalus tigris TaxID=88082 RepID=UPI00192F4A11|nr:protein monoglycylase TTLL8 [Crotalus tigris]XP_039193194.1 protein monoglycylase TTLL8 [Crotalus tigris]XP_039193202.1 protein monoglycylase TTLL8 [Crotalus tigris]
MNRLHVERKSKNEETKHEGENSLTESELSPEKNLNIALDNCLPVVSCHHGMFPEFTPRSVEELPPPPKIDKYKLARFLADKAIRERRIFTICGPYPVIRSSLRKRGWVERKNILKFDIQNHKDEGTEVECDNGVKNESKTVLHEEERHLNHSNDIHDIMSRLIRNEETSFYWTTKKDAVDYYTLHIDQMLNHYSKTGSFTTKIGLCLHMRNLPWYVSVNPNSFFPRCYAICLDDDKSAFIDDFRKTAAFCIIKWVVNLHISDDWSSKENSDKEDAIQVKDYELKKVKELPGELVEMACKICETYLEQFEHEDIDAETDNVPVLSETEWNQFIDHYYSLIHEGAVICNADSYFIQCQNILHKIRLVNPQQEIDGLYNIWIIKPGAKSRGREIVCKNRLDEILKLVEPTDQFPIKDHKWVVQKYIEKPLLIYDTKFDIRQWFLVTDWNPLTIWFYKESYLRFSTQRFSLENLHSSIHLCNNFVQKNYKNASDRSSQLPYHNMWSSSKFQEYLQKRGLGHVWCNIIYPSMKKILIYIIKMAQEQVEPRRSSFELYGADFILGSDFKPWLIEINSSPTMHPSTPITMDLCAKVQEDTIKVVLDKKLDKNCETGNFELLWRQPMLDMPPFNSTDLIVEGIGVKKLKKHVVISNFNFIEPLLNIVQSSTNQESKGDSIPPINEKQIIKVKHGNSTLCTLPKTLEKKSEKSTKVKSTNKKHIKIIDFPHITILQEAAIMPDKKKSKAIKEPRQQTGNQAATSFPNSNSLDWALLQPSKNTGLQNETKKTPCLVCGDGFQSEKTCKRCSSFCATVLQGGSYLPMSPCSAPEKMAKTRVAAPYYGFPKYF